MRAECRQRGQALVEFGLVLPVVLLLLLGMVDFGRAYVFGVAAQQGAREAARLGANAFLLGNPSGGADDMNRQIMQRLIDASLPGMVGCVAPSGAGSMSCTDGYGIAWTITVQPAGAKASGSQLTVTARGSMPLLVGFLTGVAGISTIDLQGQASMVVQ